MINSPLNYPGNKYKLLSQIIPLLSLGYRNDKFVDVFAGSGLVGLNSGQKNVILNDNSMVTVSLLNYFISTAPQEIIDQADAIIERYGFTDTYRKGSNYYKIEKHEGLSKYNRDAYDRLKQHYNAKNNVPELFALIIFGFNHYIRFNSSGLFNVPVGKVDFSASLRKKTIEYSDALCQLQPTVTCKDFRDPSVYEEDAFYYFDPPYLITQAPYNVKWSEKDDIDLMKILDNLHSNGMRFALSNVLSSNGKMNIALKEWSKKYKVINLNRKYLNANYRKKNLTIAQEVLICNYDI